jgi:hypothetical protein
MIARVAQCVRRGCLLRAGIGVVAARGHPEARRATGCGASDGQGAGGQGASVAGSQRKTLGDPLLGIGGNPTRVALAPSGAGISLAFDTGSGRRCVMPFSKLNLAPNFLKWRAGHGIHGADPHPAPRHPGRHVREGPHRLGADRHRQDRGLRASRPHPPRHPQARRAPGSWSSSLPASWRPRWRRPSGTLRGTPTSGRPCVHGGVGYGRQRSELRAGTDIVVATPGRLMDFLQEGELKLGGIQILILDEVDRMLDMGFIHDVKRIIQKCPPERQTLFFSATVPPEIAAVASFAFAGPRAGRDRRRGSVTTSITHAIYPVAGAEVRAPPGAPCSAHDFNSVLVFSRTKHGADRIARRLREANHSVGRPARQPLAEPADGGPRGLQERQATRSWSRPTSPPAASTSRASPT